jgi:hypothetical protein
MGARIASFAVRLGSALAIPVWSTTRFETIADLFGSSTFGRRRPARHRMNMQKIAYQSVMRFELHDDELRTAWGSDPASSFSDTGANGASRGPSAARDVSDASALNRRS